MNKLINEYFETAMTDEQKERMLEKVRSRLPRKTNRVRKTFLLKAAVAAAVIVCLATTAVFAQEIAGFLGFLKYDEIIGENVRDSEFFYADENVEITIEELVSDGMSVRAVVHYHALNDDAAEWLNKFKLRDESGFPMIMFDMDYSDGKNDDGLSHYGSDVQELKEYSDQYDKYFWTAFVTDGDICKFNNTVLTFTVPSGKTVTQYVDCSATVEMHEYLFEEDATFNNYKLIRLVYSPLTFKLTASSSSSGGIEEGDLYLYYDGVKHDMLRLNYETLDYAANGKDPFDFPLATYGFSYQNKLTYYTFGEAMLYSTNFVNPIDLDLLEGIEIGGVYYSLK